jgi:predicted DNA-binding transcriptional regulator
VEYAGNTISGEFFDLINFKQPDLLERIWQSILLKIDLTYTHPSIFNFVTAMFSDTTNGCMLLSKIKEEQGVLAARVRDGIDISLFKEGLDTEKTINIIWWTLNSYAIAQVSPEMTMDDIRKEYDRYLKELKEYFDVLREAFYK